MRLPIAASSPAPRRDTGTITFSGAGATCRSSESSRSAPATTASATSLSETPRACLTASRSATGSEWPTSVRRGPIGSLRNEDGAGRATSSPTAIAARRSVPPRPRGRAGRARGAPERAQRLGAGVDERVDREPRGARAPRRSSGCPAARAARAPPGRGRAAAARRRARTCRRPARGGSSSAARRSRPRGAARGGSPTAGACGRAGARAPRRRARRSAPPTAAPRRARRTCRRMSKCSASTHTGCAKPPGGKARRWRKRGVESSREATCACTRASVIAGRAGSGRKRPRQATCMCALAVSVWRKEASSGVRRSAMTAHGGAAGRGATWPGGRRSGAPVSPCGRAGRGCARG